MAPHDPVIEPEHVPSGEDYRISLAALVDYLAGDGPRDRSLVIRAARWWMERRAHIRLALLDRFPLQDVVVTFRIDESVKLVVTGVFPDAPGDVTIHFADSEFPSLDLLITRESLPSPLSIAILDYGVRGREFVLLMPWEGFERGDVGRAICLTMVDDVLMLRGQLDGGRRIQIPEELFELGP
ncbi:MAG: hypothetical protein CMH54_10770 [Myxococcales bacterium]|nr:hypothetical protein [Myxococcales bacterium]